MLQDERRQSYFVSTRSCTRSKPVLWDMKIQQEINHGDNQKSYDIRKRLTAAVGSLKQPDAKILPEEP